MRDFPPTCFCITCIGVLGIVILNPVLNVSFCLLDIWHSGFANLDIVPDIFPGNVENRLDFPLDIWFDILDRL